MKKAIILSLLLALVLTGCGVKAQSAAKVLTPDEAKAKITDYINNTLFAGTAYKATVESISEVEGLYKMSIDVNNQKADTYMTKNATLFFTQAYDMLKKPAAATTTADQSQQAPTVQTVNGKLAKPTVQLFVMSQCPYGTQIEKGILPVVSLLGKKIDFKVEFCDYSMHNQNGPVELTEEMNQYCIEKNEPQNYQAYLSCYLTAGDSAPCIKSAKINTAKLASCVAATDKTYNIIAGFNDKSTWVNGQFPQFNVFKADNDKYKVQGSPTLVINGETISSARDSASLLATICSAFTTQPVECQQAKLSSATPSVGFGTASDSSGSTGATCNTPTQQ